VFVRWLLPAKLTRIHIKRKLNHGDARADRLESVAICHVNLDATTTNPTMLLKRRAKYTASKVDTGLMEFIQSLSILFRFYIRCAHKLERFCSPPALGKLCPFEVDCSW